MDLSLLDQITWWIALIGYSYAVLFGYTLIRPIVRLTYDIVDPCKPIDPQWQPFMTGAVERILYVSSLLVGRGEFILVWVGLKMALQYKRWFPESKSWVTQTRNDEEKILKGRQRFMCALNGNGLSVLHSFVSFLVIHWLQEGKDCRLWIAAVVSLVVWALSVFALDRYKRKGFKELNVKSPEEAERIIKDIYNDGLGLEDAEHLKIEEKHCTAVYKVEHQLNKTKVRIPKGCFPGDIGTVLKTKIANEFLKKLTKPSQE